MKITDIYVCCTFSLSTAQQLKKMKLNFISMNMHKTLTMIGRFYVTEMDKTHIENL